MLSCTSAIYYKPKGIASELSKRGEIEAEGHLRPLAGTILLTTKPVPRKFTVPELPPVAFNFFLETSIRRRPFVFPD
jgi:hypothetical protein